MKSLRLGFYTILFDKKLDYLCCVSLRICKFMFELILHVLRRIVEGELDVIFALVSDDVERRLKNAKRLLFLYG